MSTFTPGPWQLVEHAPNQQLEVGYYDEGVAQVVCTLEDIAEDYANARLVAAAPEMLAMLKDAEKHCGVIPLDALRKLIAKATGAQS